MESIIAFLKEFDIHTILSIIGIVWFFTRPIKKDIRELKDEIKLIQIRLTRLEARFEERGYWESRNKKIGED